MAKELEPGRGPQLSQQELDLIERFQTAYNAIDRRHARFLVKKRTPHLPLSSKSTLGANRRGRRMLIIWRRSGILAMYSFMKELNLTNILLSQL